MQENKSIALKIIDRSGVIYSGIVSSLSTNNEKGVFDVLLNHANIISIIKDGASYVDAVSKIEHKIGFSYALLKASKNECLILLPGS